MKKIGMIGFGNMAQAIVQGWMMQKVLEPAQIYASARDQEKLAANADRFGIHASSTAQIAQECDVVFLCVKPNKIAEAVADVKEALADKMIVSIAAGMPFDAIEAILPGTHHISIVPNTPISVGQGIAVVQKKNSLSQDELAQFEMLLEPVALLVMCDDSQMSIAGTIAGCAPAFTAMYIEALADAGVQYGLSRQMAYEISAKMIEGVGAMYMASHTHPGAMKDAVCSPAGTTIRGVNALEKRGFRGDVMAAVDAIEGKGK